MNSDISITILGCGASGGVPMIGCQCVTCQSDNPKNKRMRCSLLVESNDTKLIVDTAPELRLQALRAGVVGVDAILYTHAHADHVHGIDDARSFNYHSGGALPVYGTAETFDEIHQRFNYAFGAPVKPGEVWFKPSLEAHEIKEYDEFTVGNIDVLSFMQHHGKMKSTGYRFGNIAYSPDVNNFADKSLQLLDKLDVWVVDCLRYRQAPTHAHLDLTLAWIDRLKPRLSILTHMAHELEYEKLLGELPANVVPAYDGMRIQVDSGVIRIDGLVKHAF